EYWKPFVHPQKFDGVLPVLWENGGVKLYRVPLRHTSLAHVVARSALATRAPIGYDDAELNRYADALDDASLPESSLTWNGRNQVRVDATVNAGQVLSIQINYHAGWRGSIDGIQQELHRDGLGFIWIEPSRTGPVQLQLNYRGTLAWRLTHALTAC